MKNHKTYFCFLLSARTGAGKEGMVCSSKKPFQTMGNYLIPCLQGILDYFSTNQNKTIEGVKK
jgi:hypothetical protein